MRSWGTFLLAESRPRVRKMAVDSDKASYSPMTAQHPMYFRWCVRMAAGEEGGCVLKCLPSMHFLGRTPGAPTATIPWRQSYFSAAVQPNRKIRHGSVTTRAPLQCAARFQMDAFVGAKTVDGGWPRHWPEPDMSGGSSQSDNRKHGPQPYHGTLGAKNRRPSPYPATRWWPFLF